MTRGRDYSDFVHDMLVYAEIAEHLLSATDLAAFQADVRTNMAVVRALEIIGEAARHIPLPLRRRYPDRPWRKIVGTRNIVVYDYPAVDLEVIWRTVQDDLPPLRAVLRRMLQELDPESREN